ncbi:ThuA domain-containing protein [Ilumatobacter sp.]|uniref:ThuA domain-containing protein n=1 Tax=Ilumatobacter sp. TaxID=1967498 RepID=UPI003C4DF028
MTRIAVVTKGHPFDADAFFAVFDSFDDVEWVDVEHPEALDLVRPERAAEFDAFVMYDMPGVVFDGSGGPAGTADPPEGYIEDLDALLARGKGMVFLHHAVAGWPASTRYGEIIGGRFHYTPARWDGIDLPDSGYRHDVTHTVDVLDPDHPISAGVDPSFEITDEVYLFPVDEANVTPLMRSRHRFVDDGFYSADLAVRGTRYSNEGWNHPPGSDLVAWTRQEGPSRIAYIQFGDGPETYADANYRRIIHNAIHWAASSP